VPNYLGEIFWGKKTKLKTFIYSQRVVGGGKIKKTPACVTLKGDNNLKIFLEKLNKNIHITTLFLCNGERPVLHEESEEAGATGTALQPVQCCQPSEI
jgi:hypothetical protein